MSEEQKIEPLACMFNGFVPCIQERCAGWVKTGKWSGKFTDPDRKFIATGGHCIVRALGDIVNELAKARQF